MCVVQEVHDATSINNKLPVPTDKQDLHNEECNVSNPTYADPKDVIKGSTDTHITSQSPYMDPVDIRKGEGTLRQFGKSNENGNKISDITPSQGLVYSVPFNATAPTDNKTKVY